MVGWLTRGAEGTGGRQVSRMQSGERGERLAGKKKQKTPPLEKNPGSAQDETKKTKKAQDVKYTYIHQVGIYICIRIQGRTRRRTEVRDGRTRGTGNWLTHRHTAPRRRHRLQFMLSGRHHPHLTRTHTHMQTHTQSIPPLSAPVPVLSRTGCVAQLISAEGLANRASWQGLHRQSGGGVCTGWWEWEGGRGVRRVVLILG